MFKLSDGRDYFYQWDLNRRVIVEDASITQVHFCNKTEDCSLVVEVKEDELFADNKLFMTVRYAEVPNILLQNSFPIRVYAYCSDYTKIEKLFKVKERTKPSDYLYTETEVITINTLTARAEEALEAAEKALEEAEQILTDTSLSISDDGEGNVIITPSEHDAYMGNYYTKEEVDNAIANIDVSGGDVYVPTRVSELENDAGYATEQFVNDQIANIGGGGECNIPLLPFYEFDISAYEPRMYAVINGKTDSLNVVIDSSINARVNLSNWLCNGFISIRETHVTIWGQESNSLIYYVFDLSQYENQEVTLSPSTIMRNDGLNGYATKAYVNEMLGVIENGTY